MPASTAVQTCLGSQRGGKACSSCTRARRALDEGPACVDRACSHTRIEHTCGALRPSHTRHARCPPLQACAAPRPQGLEPHAHPGRQRASRRLWPVHAARHGRRGAPRPLAGRHAALHEPRSARAATTAALKGVGLAGRTFVPRPLACKCIPASLGLDCCNLPWPAQVTSHITHLERRRGGPLWRCRLHADAPMPPPPPLCTHAELVSNVGYSFESDIW